MPESEHGGEEAERASFTVVCGTADTIQNTLFTLQGRSRAQERLDFVNNLIYTEQVAFNYLFNHLKLVPR